MQVNAGTDLDPNDFAATGRLVAPNTAPVGVRLAAFIYDGLGRLIRTVRQDPNAAAEARLLQRNAGSDLDPTTTTTASAGFRRS